MRKTHGHCCCSVEWILHWASLAAIVYVTDYRPFGPEATGLYLLLHYWYISVGLLGVATAYRRLRRISWQRFDKIALYACLYLFLVGWIVPYSMGMEAMINDSEWMPTAEYGTDRTVEPANALRVYPKSQPTIRVWEVLPPKGRGK